MPNLARKIKTAASGPFLKIALLAGIAAFSFALALPSAAHADTTLSVSCSANPTNAYMGDNVSFYASASGGNGAYSYTWAEGDALYGSGSSITRTYSYAGQQYMTVRVTSNGQTQSAMCGVNVTARPYNNGNWYNGSYGRLSGSCVAIPTSVNAGDNVNWMAQNVTGGNGSYTYYWTGTDGLSSTGQTAYKTYAYGGVKTASVTITSGDGQVFTSACNPVTVNGNTNNGGWNNGYNGSLSVSCYATPSQANLFDAVTWYATVSGGNGYYTYSWNGTDSLYGTGQNVTKTYQTAGYKTANITVYSNGQSVSNSCSMNVGSYSYYGNNNGYYGGTYYNGGYYNGTGYYGNNSGRDFILGGSNGAYYGNYNAGYGIYGSTQYVNQYPYSGYAGYQSAPSSVTLIQNPQSATGGNGYSNPVSGVFLNQIPATGISLGLKVTLFALGLALWSAFAAYLFLQKKGKGLPMLAFFSSQLGGKTRSFSPQADKAQAFKEANKARRGIL